MSSCIEASSKSFGHNLSASLPDGRLEIRRQQHAPVGRTLTAGIDAVLPSRW